MAYFLYYIIIYGCNHYAYVFNKVNFNYINLDIMLQLLSKANFYNLNIVLWDY